MPLLIQGGWAGIDHLYKIMTWLKTSMLTLNPETGSVTEEPESDLQTQLDMHFKSMVPRTGPSGAWQLGPLSQQPVPIFTSDSVIGGDLRKRKAQETSEELKVLSDQSRDQDIDLQSESHIVQIGPHGEIICPKCGEELEVGSEDDFFDDEEYESDPTENEDLDSSSSELEE